MRVQVFERSKNMRDALSTSRPFATRTSPINSTSTVDCFLCHWKTQLLSRNERSTFSFEARPAPPEPSRDYNLSFAVSSAFKVASDYFSLRHYSCESAFLFFSSSSSSLVFSSLLRFRDRSRSVDRLESGRVLACLGETGSARTRLEKEGKGTTRKSFHFEGLPFERGRQ